MCDGTHLVARVGAVERAHHRLEGVAVLPPVPVREVERLLRRLHQLPRVRPVDAPEHDGRGRERRGGLPSDV